MSKTKNVEIFVEIFNNTVIQQKMGSNTNVNGARLTAGSDVYHTHLDLHPPSARDLLCGLMCKALYCTRISGVIGQAKIFRYDYKEFLLAKFDQFILDEDSQSSEEDSRSHHWTNSLCDRIIAINKHYVKTCDDLNYIRKLSGLGIIMTIEENK